MRALPVTGVAEFEEYVERLWCSRSVAPAKRRDALIVGLGLCGLRWVECSRVKIKDLVVIDATLEVRSAKGGHRRTIDVGHSWITGWLEMRERFGGGPVFPTRDRKAVRYEQVRRRVTEWTKIHFGQGFSFHCLRHTAAVRMFEATGNVVAVQRYLGHKSLQHTTTYLSTVVPAAKEGAPSFVEGSGVGLKVYDPGEGRQVVGGGQTVVGEVIERAKSRARAVRGKVAAGGKKEATAVPPASARSAVEVPPASARSAVEVPPASARSAVAVPPAAARSAVAVPPASARSGVAVPPASARSGVAVAPTLGRSAGMIETSATRLTAVERKAVGCECSRSFTAGWSGVDGRAKHPFMLEVSNNTGRIRVRCRLCGKTFGYLAGKDEERMKRDGHL